MKFEAIRQQLESITGESVTVLDETGDVFFHVDPERVVELIEALVSQMDTEQLEELDGVVAARRWWWRWKELENG